MAASDNIQVAIRVRQLIQKEFASGLKSHWSVNNNTICCDETDVNGRKPSPYVFDRVFDDTTVTVDIFEEICKPIVDSALAGFNGTIFAYGQSSSGKTFTMSGSRVQQGIIALAVDEIFTHIENIPDREFLIRVGYLEIYNEKVSDLLSAEDSYLKLQEDSDHNIQVIGLTEEVVQDIQGVTKVLKKGDAKRHTAETKQNDRSSRSHSILRFVIESRETGHEDDAVNVSNLYFVDLAGSEKANDNSGDRFREGCAINKSLFTLGMVIRKLSGDASQQHVSFRDSKLTRILQNALGGNSKTAIICTITPAHIEESDSTLKFASRAKNIKNKAVKNEVMSEAAMLKQYRLKIKELERQIKQGANNSDIHVERAELEKQLQIKEEAERQQADLIAKLQAMIVTSGSGHITQEPPKKKRRETWCPGKAKSEFHVLRPISEISPPKIQDLKDKTLPFTTRVQDNTVFEEEDSFQLLENIMVPGSSSSKKDSPDPNETIQTNSHLKELFKLQDEHETVLEELRKKDAELKELTEFTNIEREMEAEEMKQLKEEMKKLTEENKAMKESVIWLEEELMKSQNERKNLRHTMESTNAQLNAAQDGSGITEKSQQLTVSEAKVSNLSNDIEIQKSQYEFAIQQMKHKLEVYMTLLEEKGVDYNVIKARLSSQSEELEEIHTQKNNAVEELKEKHEQEVTDLRNEVDMLVLSLEKEKADTAELQKQFELEFEDQKARFQKDIAEAKEEIEIYQQMLEEEKLKKTSDNKDDNEGTTVNADVVKLAELESQFELQKQTYETEIEKLQSEVKKLNEAQQIEQEKSDEEKSVTAKDFEKLKAEYERKIEELSAQLELASSGKLELESKYEQKINDLNKIHEHLETELKEQTKEKLSESKECQTDKVERHVNFDINSEIETQKERYEDMIKDLTEERDAYLAVLEERSINESQVSNVELVKSQYEEQIMDLKSKLDKYHETCNAKSDDSETSVRDVGVEQVEQFKEQIQGLESEVEKYKDLLESEKAKSRKSEGFSFTFDESVCSKNSSESGFEHNTNCGMDLQKEMLQAEINKLKETHEYEINELNDEIEKYKNLLVKNKSIDIAKEGSNNISHDNVVIHEMNVDVNEQSQKEINDLRNKIQQLSNDLDAEQAKNNRATDDDVLDLKSEMLKAEFEESETTHLERIRELESKLASYEEQLQHREKSEDEVIEAKNLEIVELKVKLDSYDDMLQQEKAKLERILESVDERRSELEKHESMKSMYEEKIKELNEDIKIYMDLLEEGRKEQTENQQSETEEKDMTKYTEEIERLKTELEKFTNLYEMEKEKNSREKTAEHSNLSIVTDNEKLKMNIEELEEKHRKEVEFMKEEFAKFAEQHLNSKLEGNNDIEEIRSLYEKEIDSLKEELVDLKQRYEKLESTKSESESYDLKSEMLQSELDDLKESHKTEVDSLQTELEKIKSMQECSENLSLTEDIKIKYEKEVLELKEQLEKISATNLQSGAQESVNIDMDLQSEMLRAEIETLKAKHAEEIKDLQEHLQPVECKKTIDVSMNTSKIPGEDDVPDTDEVKQLRLDLENCQTCLQEEREKCSYLEQTIQTSKKEHEVYERTIEEMQEDLSTMTTQLQQLPRDIEVLQAANTRLKQEKLDLINARERFSQLSDEHEDSIQELQEKIKDLQDNIEQTENENTGLKTTIEKLEQHISIGKGMLASKDEVINKLTNDLEEQRDNVYTEVQEKVKEMTEYVNELEAKVTDTEEALKQANEKVEEFEQSEAQFSDKILNLESDVELYKEKEETLSKVCMEYEEKIVTLETDLESMKVKNVELENSCTGFEKKIEGLLEHLEMAQSNDMELKEVQCRYQDKITELDTEIMQLKNNISEIDSDRNDQRNKCETILSKVEELERELKTETEKNEKFEQERAELVKKFEQQLDESKEKLLETEEKMGLYVETLKELEDDVKFKEEENKHLCARVTELEASSNVTMETLTTENNMLKVKLENLESEMKEKLDLIKICEIEIVSLKDKLSEADNSSKEREELDRVKAELDSKIKIAQEKVKVTEAERDEVMNRAETLKSEKEIIQKRLVALEEEKLLLEEDNLQLEKGLHPTSLKYHSKPENVDWENKWTEYCREEKKKRVAVYATVRSLRKEVQKAQEKQKNAFDEALEVVYEKEKNTDVYRKLEEHLKTVNDEANTLYFDLEAERKITKELKDKMEKLDKGGVEKNDINFMTQDHPCKYKLEGFSATQKLQTAVEEHNKRISQYEETIKQYEARVARMKNEMRRLQSNLDNTFETRSMTQPKFEKEQVKAQPSPAPSVTENLSLGSSMRSGVIDHFRVCEMSAENKRLQQEIEKQKKKLSRVENLEQENTKVKEELQSFRKKYHHVAEIEKENQYLKEELKKATVKGKDSDRNTSLLGNSSFRNPLEDMFRTGSTTVTEPMPIPPSPKKEPRFKVPDLNPTKKEDTLIKECKEEVNNCKTS